MLREGGQVHINISVEGRYLKEPDCIALTERCEQVYITPTEG